MNKNLGEYYDERPRLARAEMRNIAGIKLSRKEEG